MTCTCGETCIAMTAPATPEPSNPPRLHMPWHEDMIVIPSARSRLVALVFMATLMSAALRPIRNRPSAITAAFGALIGIQTASVRPTADQKQARASPILAMIQPVSGFITSRPTGIAKSSKPSSASERSSLVLTYGMWATQLPKRMLSEAKTNPTARACGFKKIVNRFRMNKLRRGPLNIAVVFIIQK